MKNYVVDFLRVRGSRSWFERGYYAGFSFARKASRAVPPGDLIISRDILYKPGGDPRFHSLDIYSPADKSKPCPVILFVHGGGWRSADKSEPFRVHAIFSLNLARLGYVVISANYRLSPKVKHPAHSEDIADALAWVCKNIHEYNGDPAQVILSGHSAGGHIGAFLVTHPEMLIERGIDTNVIRGFVGISGVYEIAGFGRYFFAREFMIRPGFGDDPEGWISASPVSATQMLNIPVFYINAQHDTGLEKHTAAMLHKFPNPSNRSKIYKGSNHFLVLIHETETESIFSDIHEFLVQNCIRQVAIGKNPI